MINATSKQDRDEWIEAIRKSTPQSPLSQRKNDGSPKVVKEEPKKKEPEPTRPHPSSPVRQDAAIVAATVATESERLNGVDQVRSRLVIITVGRFCMCVCPFELGKARNVLHSFKLLAGFHLRREQQCLHSCDIHRLACGCCQTLPLPHPTPPHTHRHTQTGAEACYNVYSIFFLLAKNPR